MTFHLIRIDLSSYRPRREREHRLFAKTPEELDGDESFADELDKAWWQALRGFFGEHQLPPRNLMDAFLKDNTVQVLTPWETWSNSVIKDDEPHPLFSPGIDTDYFHPCYIEVGHENHYDLLSFGDGWADLLFRHPYEDERDDQEMTHTFFQPLLEGLRNAQLSLLRIQMYLTFVDDQGLHRISLVTTLEKLGLL